MSVTDDKIAATAKTPLKLLRQGPPPDGVLSAPTVTVNGGTAQQFDVSAFAYRIGGQIRYKAAQAGIAFSAVHATGINFWIGIGVYIDWLGTISTQANPNTGDQDFATEALALASIPRVVAGKVLIATITLKTQAADWDANTDALNAADLASSNLLGLKPDRRWRVITPRFAAQVDSLQTWCRAQSAAVTFGASVEVCVPKNTTTGLLTNPNLEVDRRTVSAAAAVALRCGDFDYVINGVTYHKNAATGLAFSAAHVVSLDTWGAILLLIDADGNYSTLVGEATQTTPMAYANSAAARAALPAVPAGKCPIGVLVVEAGAAAWDANTDDIVAASDLENFDLIPALNDRVLGTVTLAVDAGEPEDFTVSAFDYVIDGVKYSKAAATGLDFSAAHVCALDKFLAILIQIDKTGAISTRVPLVSGRSQTASQGYDTAELALAALPNTEAGKLAIGTLLIAADASTWTANTDNMTDEVDGATFRGFTTGFKNGFSGVEKTTQNEIWPVVASFVANRWTAATLASLTRALRGWSGGEVIVYVGSNSGVVEEPDVTLTLRPFPLNGEVG